MSRSKFILIILMLVSALLIGACSSSGKMIAPSEDGIYSESVPAANRDLSQTSSGEALFSANSAVPETQIERVIIKTANMSLVVDDPTASLQQIKEMAEGMGGYVVTSDLHQTTLDSGIKVPQGTIVIRVPAENLDQALEAIRAESPQAPISESVNSQDVTSEYVDLQSRLTNLEATEAQLNKFLEETTTTEETLSVYNEITSVSEQIEVIKGQIKYYEQSAALSSVSVDLLVNEAIQPLTIGGWQPKGVVKSAVQALINFFKGFVNFLIWLVILIVPVLLVLGIVFVLPVVLIVWLVRRRKRSKQPPASPPTTEA